MDIGLRIKELRKEKNLSQKALSNQLKVDSSQFSKIEQGKLLPTIKLLVELSSILERSIDWLLTGKESNQEQSLNTTNSNQHQPTADLNQFTTRNIVNYMLDNDVAFLEDAAFRTFVKATYYEAKYEEAVKKLGKK